MFRSCSWDDHTGPLDDQVNVPATNPDSGPILA
jgi:hypothetical protein